jgi:hypothetical protein
METYNEFINNILETRGRFACGDEYHERHHILPRCMGGQNDEENLIDLYAREHFIAHKLLAQDNQDNDSLVYAWSCMAFVKRNNQERYELTPEEYEEARTALSKAMSERNISEETLENMKKAAKERSKNPIFLENQSNAQKKRLSVPENNPMYGKHHTKEAREKIGQATRDRAANTEWRTKISVAVRGEKHANVHPVYCPELDEYFWGANAVEQKYGIKATHVLRCCRGERKHTGKHPVTGEPLSWVSVNKKNNINA